MNTMHDPIIPRKSLRAVIMRAAVLLVLVIVCTPGSLHAAMYGYMVNSTGIYRVDSQTGTATLVYSGGPFTGLVVPAAATRPSDGMLFFLRNNFLLGGQRLFRWDPAAPATAPVDIGPISGILAVTVDSLAFHPTTDVLYGLENALFPALGTINTATGASTVVAGITGLPTFANGDMAFNPLTGNLYAVVSNANTTAVIYLIPVGGGAVTTTGTITGLTNATTVTSAMFNSAGTLFVAGSGSGGGRLWTAPISGGAATSVGVMGAVPEDLASAPSPSPAITKAFSAPQAPINFDRVLTITLSNSYANPHRGASFTDTYPPGLVNGPVPGAATTCGGSLTAAGGGGSVSLSGGTIPASGSCTVTVNVRSATPATYNNTIPIGGLTTILGYSDVAANATLTVVPLPALTHLKTVAVTSDPVNGAVNPKLIPGAEALYTLRITNSGAGLANVMSFADLLSSNLELYVGDLISPGSGPVQFVDGSPTSGVSWSYISLGNAADSIDFSNNGGATWTYTPVPVGGYDPAVNAIRLNPVGSMNAAGGGNPFFELRFRARVK